MLRDPRVMNEDTLTIGEAADYLHIHFTTLYRKIRRGDRTLDGGRSHIAVWSTGGRLLTSREAIDRHLAAVNGLEAPESAEPVPARSKTRHRELARVDAALEAAGI
jgi:excisionase family DNA binding protein